MGFQSFARIGKAFDDGKFHYQYVYKATPPSPGTANFFVDHNQSSGLPKYNAFSGSALTFTPLTGSGNAGIYPGPFITGSTKHLLRWQITNITTTSNNFPPEHVYLNDYLGFYALIDADSVDVQEMDNTSSLTRYTDATGVRIALIVQAPMTSTAAVTINYVNSLNNSRSSTANIIPGANIGVCATGTGSAGAAGQATPFFPMADGCVGVKYIESVQFTSGAGGFICAALVKPIATIQTYESSLCSEKMFGYQWMNLPEIKEGAYLNLMVQRSGSGAGTIRSELIFINS